MRHESKQVRRGRGGFTLLELLVVGMLGTLVLAVIANVWRWYGYAATQQQIAVSLAQELKIASEAIAQDYGGALASRTLDGSTLQLDLDGGAKNGAADWESPDTVIEYSTAAGKLLRRDLMAETEAPIASHIETIEASAVNGHLEVKLTAKLRKTEEVLTLRLNGT
jgi:type II secretory pathway pseudopilin PulG